MALHRFGRGGLPQRTHLTAPPPHLHVRRVVEVLREKGVPVRALVRSTTRASKLLPAPEEGALEVAYGDVFQYASLPAAFGDANALVICTGSRDFRDPLGPFNIDYQVGLHGQGG